MTETHNEQEAREQEARTWLEKLYTFIPMNSEAEVPGITALNELVLLNLQDYHQYFRDPQKVGPQRSFEDLNNFYVLFKPETRLQLQKIIQGEADIDDLESTFAWRLAQLLYENRLWPAFEQIGFYEIQAMHEAMIEYSKLDKALDQDWSERKNELKSIFELTLKKLAEKILFLDTTKELSWNELTA